MMNATQTLLTACLPSANGPPMIGLDTCCVQYYISNPPVQPWADCLDPIFQAGVSGQAELYISTVVVSELLAHVHFDHRHNAGYDPELDLMAIMNRHFRILDVDGPVANAAGRLRGNYAPGDTMSLKTPDALIGATSLQHNHTLFVTNDRQLADAFPTGTCIYLRDIALDWLGREFPAGCLDATGVVKSSNRGPGLPSGASVATLGLGSVKPDPRVSWKRILADGFTVASALNEPCVLFVLTQRNGRKTETTEVLFWHEGLKGREPHQVLKKLRSHLELKYDQKKDRHLAKRGKAIHIFCFTSMDREHTRQSQPSFNSKSDHRKKAGAWNGYLSPLRHFRAALGLPQTTWLFCENGAARELKVAETLRFLDRARNVLGWEDGQ